MNETQVNASIYSVIRWKDPIKTMPSSEYADNTFYNRIWVIYKGQILPASYNDDGAYFNIEGVGCISTLDNNDNSVRKVTAWAYVPRIPPNWA